MAESPSNNTTQVLIAGAGPSGLVLALWLKKKGINVRIVDKSPSPGTTSRALAIQARTLEFYRQLGIADIAIKGGIATPEIVLRRFGKVVSRGRVGALGKDLSAFPYLLFYSQDLHEAALCEILKQQGVEVERNTEVVSFTQNSERVTAVIQKPHGPETITADYLCGCDGAHSAVRHILNIDFQGGTYSQVFFVADVVATGEMAEAGVQVSVSRKDFCIVMPIAVKGSVRLTGIVPPEAEGKSEITFADVAKSVATNTGLKVTKVNWFSSYHVHHRVAQKFRMGRVFLSGDAGHIHSPAGGQGMNTGIGDAVNLAWKLADVLHGRLHAKILDSYESERLAFAKVLVRTTDTAFRFFATRSFLGGIFRVFLFPTIFTALTKFKGFLSFAFKALSQIRIEYRSSLLSTGATGALHAGDRLPWVLSGDGDNFACLASLSWQAHVYGEIDPAFQQAMTQAKLDVRKFTWNAEAGAKGLQKDAVYVIRPDGYIGLAHATQDAGAVDAYFRALK